MKGKFTAGEVIEETIYYCSECGEEIEWCDGCSDEIEDVLYCCEHKKNVKHYCVDCAEALMEK